MQLIIISFTACITDEDCTSKNTECRDEGDGLTCLCEPGFEPQAQSANGDCKRKKQWCLWSSISTALFWKCRCDYWYLYLFENKTTNIFFHSQTILMTLLDCPFLLVHSYCTLEEMPCTGNELSRIIYVGCKKLVSQYSHLKEMLAYTTLWRNYLKILFRTNLVCIL